jgi:hypothetical protein
MPTALAALAGQALACIEDPIVVEKILAHLDKPIAQVRTGLLPRGQLPPTARLTG